jgi:hypothetical protein
MSLKFKVAYTAGDLAKAFESKYEPMAKAATAAMRETVNDAKGRGRAAISSAGGLFPRQLPNALRSAVFPKSGESAEPAGLIYIRSKWAGEFEDPTTIVGSPYLWVPLKGVPGRIGRKRIRPGLIRGLITIRRPGKPPMLGIRVRASEARFGQEISLALLRRSSRAKRGEFRVIPLFVGIPRAQMRKRYSIAQACEQAMSRLPGRYYSNLKDA